MVEDLLVDAIDELIGVQTAILAYIVYEFRYGRGRELQHTLRSFVPAIIVLAQEVETVDEKAIIEMLPTSINTPSVLLDVDEVEVGEETSKRIERIEEQLGIDDDTE